VLNSWDLLLSKRVRRSTLMKTRMKIMKTMTMRVARVTTLNTHPKIKVKQKLISLSTNSKKMLKSLMKL
jgi:hypothetical protein